MLLLEKSSIVKTWLHHSWLFCLNKVCEKFKLASILYKNMYTHTQTLFQVNLNSDVSSLDPGCLKKSF